MIVKYTTNRKALKNWIKTNSEKAPISQISLVSVEDTSDLAQAVQFLHTMHKSINQQKEVTS